MDPVAALLLSVSAPDQLRRLLKGCRCGLRWEEVDALRVLEGSALGCEV